MAAIDVNSFNLDALRSRLRDMSDDELLKFGKSARWLCDPKNNPVEPPREVFVIQLKETRELNAAAI